MTPLPLQVTSHCRMPPSPSPSTASDDRPMPTHNNHPKPKPKPRARTLAPSHTLAYPRSLERSLSRLIVTQVSVRRMQQGPPLPMSDPVVIRLLGLPPGKPLSEGPVTHSEAQR